MMRKPLLNALLLAGFMLMPAHAMAQQINPDWSPTDDPYSDAGTAEQVSETPVHKPRGGRQGPRVDVTPYIEAQQVIVADLKNGGDVLTYSTVAAGIDASIATRQAEAQVSLRYERRIGYDNGVADQDNVGAFVKIK